MGAVAALVGCSANGSGDVDPKPDPVGSSSSAGGSGVGGAGGESGTGGSGASDGTLPGYKSGSRLKVKVLVGDDGSERVSGGWLDTTLNVGCSALVATDGVKRCLPDGPSANSYFSDSGCTVPLHAHLGGCAVPGYVRRFVGAGECAVWESRVVGAEHQGTIYAGGANFCGQAPAPTGSTVYALSDAAPATDFVAFTEATLE
jgi:hypothetical protein